MFDDWGWCSWCCVRGDDDDGSDDDDGTGAIGDVNEGGEEGCESFEAAPRGSPRRKNLKAWFQKGLRMNWGEDREEGRQLGDVAEC